MKDRALTDAQKESVFSIILEVWKLHPHLRFGQMLINSVVSGGPVHLWDIEDFAICRQLFEYHMLTQLLNEQAKANSKGN